MSDLRKMTGEELAERFLFGEPWSTEAARRLRSMDWISVTERYPADWQRVLVVSDDTEQVAIGLFGDGGWEWDGEGTASGISHWMPLPEPSA